MLNPNDKSRDSARKAVEDDDGDTLQLTLRGDFKVGLPFTITLHDLLDDAEANGKDDIVSFLQDGKSFAVHKPFEFIQNIMPRYFKTNKIKSFQRQLLHYGFKRVIREGCNKPGYYHDLFTKGNKSLSLGMTRKPKKSNQQLHRAEAISLNLSIPLDKTLMKDKSRGQPPDCHTADFCSSQSRLPRYSTVLNSIHQSRELRNREIDIYISPRGVPPNMINHASTGSTPSMRLPSRGEFQDRTPIPSFSGRGIQQKQASSSSLHHRRSDTFPNKILPPVADLGCTAQAVLPTNTQSLLEVQNLQRSLWTKAVQEEHRSMLVRSWPSFSSTIESTNAGATFNTSEAGATRRVLLDQEQQCSLFVAGSNILHMTSIEEE